MEQGDGGGDTYGHWVARDAREKTSKSSLEVYGEPAFLLLLSLMTIQNGDSS